MASDPFEMDYKFLGAAIKKITAERDAALARVAVLEAALQRIGRMNKGSGRSVNGVWEPDLPKAPAIALAVLTSTQGSPHA